MKSLIQTPQFSEKKVRYVLTCSSYINDIQRTINTSTFCTKKIDEFCKNAVDKWGNTSIHFREKILFPLNKYFSKFYFERGSRIIYNELFYEPTPLYPASYQSRFHPSLIKQDKNISRFVEKKVERFPLNKEYLKKIDSFLYKTEYYEIREPLITYLEKKYPKKKQLIKELKKLFSTAQSNCKDFDTYLEKEARFLLETTTKNYAESLKC